ncbi:hypothetical protein Tco_0857496 [Tanacetum coccineum]|uniref:Uncharacterized protein n=1 Tax=Tanacetum coccineum TaxID=301880 RepID=A0ABQ5BAN1_9ASTR
MAIHSPFKERLESPLVETWLLSQQVSDTVLKSTELGAEAKGSLVLELEDLTLETQDAKPAVSESEDLPTKFQLSLASSRMVKNQPYDLGKRLSNFSSCIFTLSLNNNDVLQYRRTGGRYIFPFGSSYYGCGDICGVAETGWFVRFESDLETQKLVQKLTQRTQVQLLMGKRM